MQSTITLTRDSLPRTGRRLERTPFDFAALFLLLLILLITATLLIWQFWHTNRIFSGVQINGVLVGGLTRAQALDELARYRREYPAPAVSLYYGGQQWPIPAAHLQMHADLLGAVNDAYLVGRQGNWVQRTRKQLVALLGGANLQPTVAFDTTMLRQALADIAGQVHRPGRPTRQIGEITLPAEAGIDVDMESTLDRLLATLQESASTTLVRTPLAVVEVAPAALPTTVTTTAAAALRPPLQLHDDRYGLHLALDPVLLSAIVREGEPPQIDEEALRQQLAGWAEQLDIAPQNARLRFNAATGGVTVLQQSQVGRQLDIEATLSAVRNALTTGGTQAPLVMVEAPPAVDMNRIAEMGIRELVARGTTFFKGSSAARVHNIRVAAEKFEGLVIPPGEIFSFNQGVEDVSAANGFEDSLIIWGDQTATGVGGGVCQVSTTVFRAAYNAGLPIVERYNHGYIVDWYGAPGLDATIFTPTVDFRFRNDTGAYLLIEPVVNSAEGMITFNLYGTKPNRQVSVGAPVQSEIIDPEPPEYRVDESLTAGQRKQVEWEQKGMTVTVTRTIVENGTTRTDTVTSRYQPWRAVYLVAPGTEIPATATPEATPSTAQTNAEEASATPNAPAEGP
jgi:vancomycin resistance protein YoaR